MIAPSFFSRDAPRPRRLFFSMTLDFGHRAVATARFARRLPWLSGASHDAVTGSVSPGTVGPSRAPADASETMTLRDRELTLHARTSPEPEELLLWRIRPGGCPR